METVSTPLIFRKAGMAMKAKRMAVLVCAALLLAQAPAAPASAAAVPLFTDVSEADWHYPYLKALKERGLVAGNEDGSYKPGAETTVAEFLAFALRVLGEDQPVSPEGHWAANYLARAEAMRLSDVGEYPDPDAPISREKIAKVVVRAIGGDVTDFGQYREMFSDYGDVTEREAVLKAIKLGILAGYEDGTFRPRATATRAEAAAMVLRMADQSYRLEVYGNVFFNPGTDLDGQGRVTLGKSKDFVMEAVDALRIDKSASGRVVVSGVVPEVPEGQFFMLDVYLLDARGKKQGFLSTATVFEDEKLPASGAFRVETEALNEQTTVFMIDLAVCIGSPPLDLDGAASFSIYHNINDPSKDTFHMEDEDGDGDVRLDFQLTKNIWGW
jgi:hypothetical protein